jgi:hypothetical protein
MNCEEIRQLKAQLLSDLRSKHVADESEKSIVLIFMAEIAAQMAEHNEFERLTQEWNRSQTEKRDELLAAAAASSEAIRQSIAHPQITPVFQVPQPGEIPHHIGCFILMPDGTYGMAIQGEDGPGIVPLSEDEAKQLLALLSRPVEGKPS